LIGSPAGWQLTTQDAHMTGKAVDFLYALNAPKIAAITARQQSSSAASCSMSPGI
jgi:hypothetical protein